MFMQKVHYKSVHSAQNCSQIPLRCEAYRKNQIGMLRYNISRFYNPFLNAKVFFKASKPYTCSFKGLVKVGKKFRCPTYYGNVTVNL